MAPSSTLPRVLKEVFAIGFNYSYDEETDTITGVDFEPYDEFEDPEETTEWFRDWTGNDEADSSPFRIFGQTGAGDYAGFWLTRRGVDITEQPVVIFTVSEGPGVIAKDMNDLLWIFANGSGPNEAFGEPERETEVNEAFERIAIKYAPERKRPTKEIVKDAKKEFPHFRKWIMGMTR